jgi:hypothetical protein
LGGSLSGKAMVNMFLRVDVKPFCSVHTSHTVVQADKYGLTFYEVSAKTGLSLNEAFGKLTYDYAQNYKSVLAGVQEAVDA